MYSDLTRDLNFELTESLDGKQETTKYSVEDFAEGADPDDLSNTDRNFVVQFTESCIKDDLETSMKATGTFDSLGDCYTACRDETTMKCSSFSFCRPTGSPPECTISSTSISVLMDKGDKADNVKKDTRCNTYVRSYIKRFNKMRGMVSLTPGGKTVEKAVTAENCALECTYDKDGCESFELCDDSSCVLRKDHFVDLKKAKDDKFKKTSKCDFYTGELVSFN